MRGAIWVLNIFAAIWGAIGLSRLGSPTMAAPIIVSAALIVWGSQIPSLPRPAGEGARIGRLIGIWSSVEGVAIFATFALTKRFGVPDAAMPILAIIVGLHFVPLARGIPMPIYFGTGAAMIAVGAGALLLPATERYAATGIPCAAILWATCVALIVRGRRQSAASHI